MATQSIVFDQTGDFEALSAAETWLTENGFSYGSLARNMPIGIVKGNCIVPKWYHITQAEINNLDGRMVSNDFRGGPVEIQLKEIITDEKTEYQSIDEWYQEGEKLFGKNRREWKFICPSCNHIAKVQDWIDLKADDAVAFSCIGRWMNTGSENTFKNSGGPCNYAGGGLFAINPVKITDKEGNHSVFQFAPTEEVNDASV